tara:strand:+ start:510 stop:764 length:255 start_codon:yes stop_codon:yes gene_type:complete
MSDISDSYGWRSVELDEPPEDMVLIYDWQHDEISTAIYLEKGRFVGVRADENEINIYQYDQGAVTEWQPMPPAPKGYDDMSIKH